MKFKTNLHLHTNDDPQDVILYSFYDIVHEAKKLDFQVLALTCHNRFIEDQEYKSFAEQNGILLILGVEKTIEGKHVVVLNPDTQIELINTFADLGRYKSDHPEIFIIASHPYFPDPSSLLGKLKQHIELFDAIELSWFYSKWIDFNKPAEKIAKRYNLPYLATSDTHHIELLNSSYAQIEVKEKTSEAIFDAIRKKRFENISSPQLFLKEMVWRWNVRNRIRKK